MKFEDLKTSLTNGVKPIYLIEGEDAFLRESALKLLKDAFLTEPDFNLSNLSVDDVKQDPEVLFTAVQSYPFMGDYRFVVLRELKVLPLLSYLRSSFKYLPPKISETSIISWLSNGFNNFKPR